MWARLIREGWLSPGQPLFPIVRKYAWSVPVVALLEFLAGALEGLSIGLLIPLLGHVGAPGTLSTGGGGILDTIASIPLLFPPNYQLAGVAGLVLFGIALRGILRFVSGLTVQWVDGRAAFDIRSMLADRLLHVGYPFLLREDTIRLLNILSSDSWRASEAIQKVFKIVASLASIAVFMIILAFANLPLFFFALLGAMAIRMLQGLTTRHVANIGRRVVRSNKALAERMLALCLTIPKSVRLFGRERDEHERFDAASEEVRKVMLQSGKISAAVGPVFELLYGVLFLGMLAAAQAAGIGVGVLIVFLVLMYRMQPQLRDLSVAATELGTLSASIREIEWLLDPTDQPPAPTGDVAFAGLKENIVFDNVAFEYRKDRNALPAVRDLNFTIRADRSTALVGPSGSGKSTVVNLLVRLIAPTAGRILFDGTDLTRLDPNGLRAQMAIAGQDVELFEGTVAENIGYGVAAPRRDEIEAAGVRANAHSFITRLPQGYDTVIGGPGLGLSGGERQRVGIARALLRNPRVLILDEATSALDVAAESVVLDLVRNRPAGQTIIVISHRETTLADCDDRVDLVARSASFEAAPALGSVG